MHAKLAAGMVCGRAHEAAGRPCQDRAGGYQDDTLAAVVLCDGAGSCAHSERAAEAVVHWLPGYLSLHFDQLYAGGQAAAGQLVRDGQQMLTGLGLLLEESYCTLLFWARHRDGRWLCGHIGDGFLFVRDAEGTRVLSYPENGMFSYETYFLSEPDAAEHLRLQRGLSREESCVLLASDGSAEALYDQEQGCPAPAVEILCSWLASPDNTPEAVSQAFHRAMEEKLSAHTHDDMSLAALWCDAPACGPDLNRDPDDHPDPDPVMEPDLEYDPALDQDPDPDYVPDPAPEYDPTLDPDLEYDPALDPEYDPGQDLDFGTRREMGRL